MVVGNRLKLDTQCVETVSQCRVSALLFKTFVNEISKSVTLRKFLQLFFLILSILNVSIIL